MSYKAEIVSICVGRVAAVQMQVLRETCDTAPAAEGCVVQRGTMYVVEVETEVA